MSQHKDQDYDKLVYSRLVVLQKLLGPLECAIMRVQSVLVWEKPWLSTVLLIAVNILFWLISHTSYRLVYIVSMTTLLLIVIDTWKRRIWPEIKVRTPEDEDKEGWTPVHPRLLSVPELCHYIAELWTTGTMLFQDFWKYRREHPAKFCALTSFVCLLLATVGQFISGLLLTYISIMSLILWPCVAYNSLLHKLYMKCEPALMQLEYSMKIRRHRSKSKKSESDEDNSKDHVETDTDSELGEFCPSVNLEATAALARAITDSEDETASSPSPTPELQESSGTDIFLPNESGFPDIEYDPDLDPFTSGLELPSFSNQSLDVSDTAADPSSTPVLYKPRPVPHKAAEQMDFKDSHFKESSSSSEEGDETISEGLKFPDVSEIASESSLATEKAIMAASYAGQMVSKTIGTVMTNTISGISMLSGVVASQVGKTGQSSDTALKDALQPVISHSPTSDSDDLADFEVLNKDELESIDQTNN